MTTQSYYQPLLSRLQFIYTFLTGEVLDRGGSDWKNIVALKEARDVYVHRVGKESSAPDAVTNDAAIVDGFASVRRIIAQVFRKTPEFADKFVYRYLAYWSCESEEPFVWDGSKGDSFYLGLGNVNQEAVAALFAPMPGSFQPQGS